MTESETIELLKKLLTEARQHIQFELDCTLESCCELDTNLEPILSTLPADQVSYVNGLDVFLVRIDEALAN